MSQLFVVLVECGHWTLLFGQGGLEIICVGVSIGNTVHKPRDSHLSSAIVRAHEMICSIAACEANYVL